MSWKSLAILGILALFAVTSPAYAVKQYRCYGKVQYRPCTPSEGSTLPPLKSDSIFSPEFALPSPQIVDVSRMAPQDSPRAESQKQIPRAGTFARIVSKKFAKMRPPSPGSPPDGVWSGTLEGNGTIHLTLRVMRAGVLEQSRYMGNVSLKNKSTSFRFVSSVPQGSNWTWDIVARSL